MRTPSLLAATLFITAGLATPIPTIAATPWQPVKGPLFTRWAKDVSPTNALPEYPRPQMVRTAWLNLNGLWHYAITDKASAAPQTFDGSILVPFPVESALSGVMKRVSDSQRLWYHRTFDIPKPWAGKRILLHFGAVDWETAVTVNGKPAGTHRGGYDPFTFDITPMLNPTGPQEIEVSVWDPTNHGPQPRGKQVLNPGGIFYTPTTGIWQTVWLEPVLPTHIDELTLTPDVGKSLLRVQAAVAGPATGETVIATAMDGSRPVAEARGAVGAELQLHIPHPKLWWPQKPFLYNLKVSVRQAGRDVDSVKSYFGMRKMALGKDSKGITRPMLNGKFVFQVGPLDQGFWPDGIYTAPTDAALRWDIQATKDLGFNMTRKHVKVEPERWYYWCDKLGLLVWQDMPAGDNNTPAGRTNFEVELHRMLEIHRNHPCIIQWVVFNEGWGEHDTARIVDWVQKFDPSRLVDDASGWTDMKVGSVIDMHKYPGPGSPAPEPMRAAVLGEFGGLGLRIPGHAWSEKGWGYRGMADRQGLTNQYVDLLRRAWGLEQSAGLSAVVYTQITDVETESNGLFTYDRALLKPDLKLVRAANEGHLPPIGAPKVIVPTSQKTPVEWRYTTDAPAADWFMPGFDDSTWKQGPAGFGTTGTPGAVVRTVWNTNNIWIRRHFTWPARPVTHPHLLMHHDDDTEVYINGVLALTAPGYVGEYTSFTISPAALATLKPGQNVIAIHCLQKAGGQYIDAGIIDGE